MATTSNISNTLTLDVESENIGAFIGNKGANFKKMISTMKKDILNKSNEITPKEWSSITITLKFEKTDDKIKAIYECDKEHEKVIKDTLTEFVKYHKSENKKYEKKRSQGVQIVYRIGSEHRFIGRMIGVAGSNIAQLKSDISDLDSIEKVIKISIEEQTKRFNGTFRNIGDRECSEHIMMFINIKGSPDFEKIQTIIEEYVKLYTTDNTNDKEEEEDPEEEDADSRAV